MSNSSQQQTQQPQSQSQSTISPTINTQQWNDSNDNSYLNNGTTDEPKPLSSPSYVDSGHAPPPGSLETMPNDLDMKYHGGNGDMTPQRPSMERLGIDGIRTPKRHNSSIFEVSMKRDLTQLPGFTEVLPQEYTELFLRKVEQCNVIFDFNDPVSDLQGKQIKQIALEELAEYVASPNKDIITPEMYKAVVDMFSKNLFRSIPPQVNPVGELFDPDEDEPVFEMAWPHMHMVYDFFLMFIESPDFNQNIAKNYIDYKFVQNLIQLFDSEDQRERNSCKTILHRVYGKFLNLRSFIRKSMNNVFFQFIYETERFNGVSELLEILGSIINGFALPLKNEHKTFLSRVLIPLHKVRSLSMFHSHLAYCVIQFLEKDPSLTEEVVMGLLKYWPKVNSSKEVLFLIEMEDIFEVMKFQEFEKIQVPLFIQLAKCISSPHFQVAERTLNYWNNSYFCKFMENNVATILPLVYQALNENETSHWNQNIHTMIYHATAWFMDVDPQLYNQCSLMYEQTKGDLQSRENERKESWKMLENSVNPTTMN